MKAWFPIVSLFSILVLSSVVPAADKPLVAVEFLFTERTLTGAFSPDELRQIETQSNEFLIDTLSESYGFLNFTDSQAPNRLVFKLDRKDPGAPLSRIAEVGFTITLEGAGIDGDPEKVYWMLRPAELYDLAPGSPDAFFLEIAGNLRNNIETRFFHALVDSLFSHVRLTETALPIREHSIWVMPFSKRALALDEGSRFNVSNEFKFSFGRKRRTYVVEAVGEFEPETPEASEDYRFGILAEALEDQSHLEDLRSSSEMTVRGVFIMKYIKGEFVESLASPDDFVPE